MTEAKRKRGNGFKDMTGEVFGKLTVLDYASSDGVQRAASWLCRCECGEEIEVRGTVLRKGDRKSCGCLDPQSGKRRRRKLPPVPALRETFGVVERHGLLVLVRSWRGSEALVEFDKSQAAWVCSECGANARCTHIETATRHMPLEMVREVAAVVAPRKGSASLSAKAGGAAEGQAANDKASAVAMAKSAIERAERVARHDEQHQRVVGEVTTRQMTDEERARLAERRAAKARTFAH